MNLSPSQGIVFGFVQGLTEFLPISSSAHLVLLPWFLGWSDPGLSFDVALHLGTLFAVVWYFWREWWALFAGAIASFREGRLLANEEAVLFWKIAVASVPGALAGLALEHAAETVLRSPLLIAGTLAGLGVLLYVSDRRAEHRRGLQQIGWREAIWIGLAQAAAIVPGVSRSGVTITMARLLAIDRESGARFSFLLAAPIIAGAALLKAPEVTAVIRAPGEMAACLASAVAGFAAIAGLLRYVRARSYAVFAIYRVLLATLILAGPL